MNHEISITLRGGTIIDTWKSYEVTLDMLSPGSAWTLELWWSDTHQSTWDVLQSRAKLGEQLYLSIDGAVQLSGTIEEREETADRKGTTMVLSGLDLAGPAIEADADPRIQLRGTTLEDALVKLWEPLQTSIFIADAALMQEVQSLRNRRHGAGVRRVNRRTQFDAFKVRPGDKIWQLSDTICKHAGYMIWTGPNPEDGTGIGLIVDKPVDSGSPKFQFERRRVGDKFVGNILEGKRGGSIRGVPTTVTAFTHSAASSSQDARMRTVVRNDGLTHPLVVSDLLPRPRFIRGDQARTVQKARKLAEREIAKSMAHFRWYECMVQGHAQDFFGDRDIFTINALAHVRDDRFGVDEDYLMTRVGFRGSRTGQSTTVRMVPKGAIKVIPDA
jgi:prophage tail gpP-like protein